jgi:hypothetical protein
MPPNTLKKAADELPKRHVYQRHLKRVNNVQHSLILAMACYRWSHFLKMDCVVIFCFHSRVSQELRLLGYIAV